jgi:hypothetical protein
LERRDLRSVNVVPQPPLTTAEHIPLIIPLNNFSGTYSYVHPKAGYTTGKLTGKVKEQMNSDSAVYRLDITFDWE